jgi:hypothetical protein
MSKSDVLEGQILDLLFNGTAIPNLAVNTAASPATTLTIALHTADPGETGIQTTNETAYTGYARVTVARTSGGWVRTGSSMSPVSSIDFGECTALPGATITHASIGTGVSNNIMYKGPLSPTIAMAVGVIPRIKNTSTITED